MVNAKDSSAHKLAVSRLCGFPDEAPAFEGSEISPPKGLNNFTGFTVVLESNARELNHISQRASTEKHQAPGNWQLHRRNRPQLGQKSPLTFRKWPQTWGEIRIYTCRTASHSPQPENGRKPPISRYFRLI